MFPTYHAYLRLGRDDVNVMGAGTRLPRSCSIPTHTVINCQYLIPCIFCAAASKSRTGIFSKLKEKEKNKERKKKKRKRMRNLDNKNLKK